MKKPAQILIPYPQFMVSEVSLVYKSKISPDRRPKVKDSASAADIFRSVWDDDKMDLCEEFKVLYLNRANYVNGLYNLSSGGITGVVADPRLILAMALKTNSVGFIMAHNHPSGNLTPSRADEELTKKVKLGANALDITVPDHIIITRDGYYSFADMGII